MRNEPHDPHPGGHTLDEVPGLSGPRRAALRGQWLETVEQVLGVAASPVGRKGLLALLACSENELDLLLARLAQVVGPVEAARLQQPTPGGAGGLLLGEPEVSPPNPAAPSSPGGIPGGATDPRV